MVDNYGGESGDEKKTKQKNLKAEITFNMKCQ